jgi:hypothetical protein
MQPCFADVRSEVAAACPSLLPELISVVIEYAPCAIVVTNVKCLLDEDQTYCSEKVSETKDRYLTREGYRNIAFPNEWKEVSKHRWEEAHNSPKGKFSIICVDPGFSSSLWKFAILNWETSSVICRSISAFTDFLSAPRAHFIPEKDQCLLEFREHLGDDRCPPTALDSPSKKCLLLDLNSGRTLDMFSLGGHLTPLVSSWGDILIAFQLPGSINIYRLADNTFVGKILLTSPIKRCNSENTRFGRTYGWNGKLFCWLTRQLRHTLPSNKYAVSVGRVFGETHDRPHTIS